MTIVFNYNGVNYFTPLITKVWEPSKEAYYSEREDDPPILYKIFCEYGSNNSFELYFESKDYAFKVYNELLDSIEEYYGEVGKHMKVIR